MQNKFIKALCNKENDNLNNDEQTTFLFIKEKKTYSFSFVFKYYNFIHNYPCFYLRKYVFVYLKYILNPYQRKIFI